MDRKSRHKILVGIIAVGALVAFLRRPTTILAMVMLLYWKAEELLGVKPLRAYELGEVLASKPETAIAAAGMVIAVASVLAFKRVKRLDLELAAGAAISAVLKDAVRILSRFRVFCVGVYELRQELSAFGPNAQFTPDEARRRMGRVQARWELIRRELPDLRKDQAEIWLISTRILDLESEHGTVIRARALVPYAL